MRDIELFVAVLGLTQLERAPADTAWTDRQTPSLKVRSRSSLNALHSQHNVERARVISESALRQLVQRIYAEPELAGCDVVFYGNTECRMIGYPFCGSPNSENVAVIIEELCLPDNRDGKGMEREAKALGGTPKGAATNPIIKNRSKLTAELIGVGASCGLTAVSVVGAAAGVCA